MSSPSGKEALTLTLTLTLTPTLTLTLTPTLTLTNAVIVSKWQEGASIDLDWGALPVTVQSVWNAVFFDKKETGPQLTLLLLGGAHAEVGFKAKGGFPGD